MGYFYQDVLRIYLVYSENDETLKNEEYSQMDGKTTKQIINNLFGIRT